MSLDQMRRLCGWHFQLLGEARLPDYQFGADLRGFASAEPKKGANVLGVLFDVDQYCIDALDEFEGYPDVFKRPEVEVVDSFGHKYKAWIYIQPADQLGGKTIKDEHMRRIIAGALENRLPEQWIKFLEGFAKS